MPAWLYSLLSPFVSVASAWALWHLTQKRADRKAEAGDEKTWRQARIDAEKKLGERIDGENRERTHWQLQREGDLAKITDILEESTEAHKLLASIAARTDGHDGRLNRHDGDLQALGQKLEAMHNHIHQLAMRHVQST